MTSRRPVRVLIVDDQVLMRRGLRKLLEIEPDVEVVGEAADGREALALLDVHPVDVALVDARMPGMDGVTLIAESSRTHPRVAAVILTTFDDEEYVVGGLRAGARGHLLKDTPPEVLVDALCRAAKGETVLGESAVERLASRIRSEVDGSESATRDPLSLREREVAELIARGVLNRDIARELYLAEGTVKNHVSSIMRKTGIKDRAALALHLAQSRRPPTGR